MQWLRSATPIDGQAVGRRIINPVGNDHNRTEEGER